MVHWEMTQTKFSPRVCIRGLARCFACATTMVGEPARAASAKAAAAPSGADCRSQEPERQSAMAAECDGGGITMAVAAAIRDGMQRGQGAPLDGAVAYCDFAGSIAAHPNAPQGGRPRGAATRR